MLSIIQNFESELNEMLSANQFRNLSCPFRNKQFDFRAYLFSEFTIHTMNFIVFTKFYLLYESVRSL